MYDEKRFILIHDLLDMIWLSDLLKRSDLFGIPGLRPIIQSRMKIQTLEMMGQQLRAFVFMYV